ncbi:MAG: ATP-binding protein [Phycisphaerae bacterium]|nr:ATP-binding protein [Phycisphaerae bacterium]
MPENLTGILRLHLGEQLAASVSTAIPTGTPRRVHGRVSLPGKATAVIGMRRAGKTMFLHQLRHDRLASGVPQERLPYINFEDERLAGMAARHLALLVEEYYRRYPAFRGRQLVTWCLDEIQQVPGWERFVRRLLDTEKVEIFLSGSSAVLLSREVATSMRGRGWEVVIHPFGFEEFLRHHGTPVPKNIKASSPAERSAMEHALLRYIELGGFPEAQGLEVADRFELLRRYVDVAMLRDVMERHGVNHVAALTWLVRHLLGSPAGLFSVEKFYARLKSQGMAVARDTLHALVHHIEDCFLIRTLWMEATSERQRMVNPRKVYPVDPGLIPVYDQSGRANRGHALETLVRVELERRRMEVTYVKTADGLEVDFLARQPGKPPMLIQVAAELDDPSVREREVRALLTAHEHHPQAAMHLITLTPEILADIPAGIAVQPAWQWLLGSA